MDAPYSESLAGVGDDAPCIRCGYNLRGLSSDGLCPECGTPVEQSLRGDLLKFANSDWLERLRFGTSLKLWNIGIIILGIFGAGMIMGVSPPIFAFVELVSSVLALWASFALTTPEPRLAMQEEPVTLRKSIRACAGAALAGSLLKTMESLAGISDIIMIVSSILVLGAIVTTYGELVYYRRFALRIPDPVLERSTTKLMWIVPIGAACMMAGMFATGLGMPAAIPAAPPLRGTGLSLSKAIHLVLGFGLCFGSVLMLVGLLWYVRLLTKYSRAFRNAIDEAGASRRL